jgi:hypothetical protein
MLDVRGRFSVIAAALRERGETLVRLGPQVRRCRCIRRELHEGLVRLGRVSIIIVAGAPFEQLLGPGQRRRGEQQESHGC